MAPRGRGTYEYTLKWSFFKLGPPNFAWQFTLTPHKKWHKFFKRGVAFFSFLLGILRPSPQPPPHCQSPQKKYVGDAVILMVLLIISYKNISKTIVLYYNEFLYYHEIKYQRNHYWILVK